ncbi:hypothetical protein [Pseudonocardia sp. T1-2H]|uniref:hypothetical protein n=1 Tax=Pseudonocardia sp. T1-2H TaxID=3128899 RepID=UPI00310112EE
MPEIADLPERFLKRHEDWHMANHDIQAPGFGVGLLDFHRDLVADVLAWMRDTGHDVSTVQPWAAIPNELTADQTFSPRRKEAVRRITQRAYTFRDLDDFGLFLTSDTRSANLHLWFHDVTMAVYQDPLVRPFATSPKSTYFYNFHGLIQNWRLAVERSLVSPRPVDWEQLLAGERLYDNDVITATITPNAMTPGPNGETAVDFVLTSTLWWGKWLNVPDGEGTGANWTISTGAPWFGGRKTVDSVALWSHQVRNGQLLTFSKAKGLGVAWPVYQLGGLESLQPNSRVTLTWVED